MQGFSDAYLSARVPPSVDLIVAAASYKDWIAIGDAPGEASPRRPALSVRFWRCAIGGPGG